MSDKNEIKQGDKVWWSDESLERHTGVVEWIINGIMLIRRPNVGAASLRISAKKVHGKWRAENNKNNEYEHVLRLEGTFTKKIESQTFSVFHSPNMASPYQVRLIAKGVSRLDYLPTSETGDICGYGQTMEQAAQQVWTKRFPDDKE